MRHFIPFMIALTLTVFSVTYISVSSQVKESSFRSELTITNAAEAFLDKVADSGAVTHKDYAALNAQLLSTGGAFEIAITVSRILPVPDTAEPGAFKMEYVPSHGWRSADGGMSESYVDPNWTGQGPPPPGVQYLVKGDNVQLVIKQVDLMNYQRTVVTRLNQGTHLGDWSYSRATRNTGSSITLDQGGS